MKKLLSYIIASGLGLWLAVQFVPDVTVALSSESNFFGINLTAEWQIFLVFAIILGLLNYFVKPILKVLALPLEIITLGLFSLVINAALIFAVDFIFKELYIALWMPLVFTTLIIWALNVVLSLIFKDK